MNVVQTASVGHVVSAPVQEGVCQGRWGWYACSRETFLKLKKLHKFYWRAVAQHATWKRWDRKLPANRLLRRSIRNDVGQRIGSTIIGPNPEPTTNEVFDEHKYVRRRVNSYENGKLVGYGFKEVLIVDDLGIVEAYQNARKPMAGPEGVTVLGSAYTSFVNDLFAQLPKDE